MKIYLLMCLNDVIGDRYYTDEEEIKKVVEEAKQHCEDFSYMVLEPVTPNYEEMVKSLIGRNIKNFFCGGFFGSREYELKGSEITRIFQCNDFGTIVIEVKKKDGKHAYANFDNGWAKWETVYKYLKEWIDVDNEEI